MKYRTFILATLAITLAFVVGCTRTTDPNEPTRENLFVSQSELNLIALTATDHFDLTPGQREQINALMKKHHEAVQVLIEEHKKGNITREELQAKIQVLEKELEEQIKLILTPEQFEKWKQHQEYMKQFGGFPYPLLMPLDQLVRVLELNEQQAQQARAIVEQALQDMRAAVQSINDKDRLRIIIGEILKRADQQFRTILNDSQKAKYDQLKHMRQAPLPYPLPFPLEHLIRALTLTPEQVEKTKAIVESAAKDIRAAVESIKDKNELNRALEQILNKADAEFRSILTDHQRAAYEQMKKPRLFHPYPYPLILPLEQLARALALTSEQVQKAKELVESAMGNIRHAVDSVKDKEELRKALESILKRTDEQFRALLTPDQAAKYEQIKKTMHQQQYPYPLILPLEALAKELALSREQIQKADTIIEAAMQDIRRAVDSIKDKDELQKVLEQIKVRADAQFKSILNPQQNVKYEEIKKKIRGSNG